jgi:hypothetical protein
MRRFVLACLLVLPLAGPVLAQPRPAIPPPVGAQNSSFNLVNRGALAIRELFVTSAGNANWGQNRLDGRNGNPVAIAPGASFAVRRRLDTNCIFDIRVVFADGRSEDRRGVNTCAVEDVSIGAAGAAGPLPATGKAADDPSIRLFNRSARPIVEFRAVPSGAAGPGDNRLAGNPLPPDASRAIALPRDGNCIFDLRVVYADGRAQERKRTNLCRIADMPVP